jgi:hypothetical protein
MKQLAKAFGLDRTNKTPSNFLPPLICQWSNVLY